MLAQTIEITLKNCIRIVNHEVKGLKNVRQSRAKGTGTKVAIVIRALEVTILLEVIGKVLAYSIPFPSELKRARGTRRAKIAPIEVATSNIETLRKAAFEAKNATIAVSKTGRAKKNAVAGFLEVTRKSFIT